MDSKISVWGKILIFSQGENFKEFPKGIYSYVFGVREHSYEVIFMIWGQIILQ